jgi:transposase
MTYVAPSPGGYNFLQDGGKSDRYLSLLRIPARHKPSVSAKIPPKANRKLPRACDFALYCERSLIERFFNKLKHYRAIATRYDKLAKIFLAGVQLASAIILLN